MKKITALLILFSAAHSSFIRAQDAKSNNYEVEILANPNLGRKDTRQVNSVLIFEKDCMVIRSRRKSDTFKQFRYSDINRVEHSYSKSPDFSISPSAAIILSVMTGLPIFLLKTKKEKHWLAITADDDFAVLKIENDNYRLIKLEFAIKNIDIDNVNEDR